MASERRIELDLVLVRLRQGSPVTATEYLPSQVLVEVCFVRNRRREVVTRINPSSYLRIRGRFLFKKEKANEQTKVLYYNSNCLYFR